MAPSAGDKLGPCEISGPLGAGGMGEVYQAATRDWIAWWPSRLPKEQSQMTNEKVIMLIEAKIQPQRRAELVEAARQYLPLVRAEPGVEAFCLTVRKDDPNTFVFLRDLQVASRRGFSSATGLH
jgi:hypothetical protein